MIKIVLKNCSFKSLIYSLSDLLASFLEIKLILNQYINVKDLLK